LHGDTPRIARVEKGKLTRGQFGAFTLYATRTIISGSADELAKTSLRQLKAA
jgi:hypothetical protein